MANDYTKKNFKINDAIFNSFYIEALTQEVRIWNEASSGTITLTTKSILGDFEKTQFLKELASSAIVHHRDPESLADITADTLEQIEEIGVKINRLSFIQKTIDSFKKLGGNEEDFNKAVAVATAMASVEDQVNTQLYALVGAIQAEATHVVGDGTADASFKDLNALRFIYGDKFNDVKRLVMHSDTAKSLADLNIDEKLDSVGGIAIQQGTIASLGIPLLIVDSPAFSLATGKAILALTSGAGVCVDSETVTADIQKVQGKQNLILSLQREWAFNVSVKGFSFDESKKSPTNDMLKAKANWTKVASSNKNLAGAIFNSKS